jgi:glycosyltransferase involved in cell wall biosynthesis
LLQYRSSGGNVVNEETTTTITSADAESPWPVMVLAHNEERHIVQCLDSLYNGETRRELEVYVMANGCTDRTEALTLEYASKQPGVKLVSIKLGDKNNAWNVFIHETVKAHCPNRPVYFFMDGDARIVPGSLSAMESALRETSYAHAASAPPASGRSMARDRKELLEVRGLVANLYALRGQFVTRLQDREVRLPLRLEGDDGLLGALIKWDLDPRRDQWDDQRIAPCADAGFTFESVNIAEWSAWRGYWRRAVRYGRRHYEFELLGPRLRREGLAGLPTSITEIYGGASALKLRVQGLFTLSNWVALRQMRSIAANSGSKNT